MTTKPSIPESIRFVDSVQVRLGPERGFLFDRRSGRIYSLNETGTVAASCIRDGASASAVIDAVVAAFEVDAARARQDFENFVAQLFEEGLLQAHG